MLNPAYYLAFFLTLPFVMFAITAYVERNK